jgi:tetratricopeptide (TPR) repeat protein
MLEDALLGAPAVPSSGEMRLDTVADAVGRGEDALAEGQWQAAREAFEAALAEPSDTLEGVAVAPPGAVMAEAEEGLARALWWLHDFEAAVGHMERAYAAFRAAGDETSAARSARWLAREHAAAFGNAAASSGWYARADGLIGAADDPERGWLALARAERASGPDEIARNAADALASARSQRDSDLEAAALVRLGYADVASGDVVAGMAKIDEAMAAATGGDVRSLETIGDVICVGISACEHAADWQRIEQWGQVVERWLAQHEHVAVLGFCYACCAEMFVASGQWETAEGLLVSGRGASIRRPNWPSSGSSRDGWKRRNSCSRASSHCQSPRTRSRCCISRRVTWRWPPPCSTVG